MVALAGDGKARAIPPWEPISDEDHALDDHARDLIELRSAVAPFTPTNAVPPDTEPSYLHLPELSARAAGRT
ncbi:hypothetical protein [Nocardia sp. NBC_01327]|uniref:hypothetical protein n=1 Tax=Nocardia sp. NBC_01327 TaxID=2903593 RepID=UPI002E1024D8|nr:hypothetical protein OG326_42845 [Nocardia sp. NBC_01327]